MAEQDAVERFAAGLLEYIEIEGLDQMIAILKTRDEAVKLFTQETQALRERVERETARADQNYVLANNAALKALTPQPEQEKECGCLNEIEHLIPCPQHAMGADVVAPERA